jgi:hypothetical protein
LMLWLPVTVVGFGALLLGGPPAAQTELRPDAA